VWNDRTPHLVWKQHSTDFGTLSGFLWSQELCNPTTSTGLESSSLAKWLQKLPQPIAVPSVEYFWLFHSLEYLLKHVQTKCYVIMLELFWAENMEQAKLIYCLYEFSAAEISFINSWPSYYIMCCVCKMSWKVAIQEAIVWTILPFTAEKFSVPLTYTEMPINLRQTNITPAVVQ